MFIEINITVDLSFAMYLQLYHSNYAHFYNNISIYKCLFETYLSGLNSHPHLRNNPGVGKLWPGTHMRPLKLFQCVCVCV